MNRILTDEQERGRSFQPEATCTKMQRPIPTFYPHSPVGCILDPWVPEWFRERSLGGFWGFLYLLCGSRAVWRFLAKKWVLNPPENTCVTKFGKQLLESCLTPEGPPLVSEVAVLWIALGAECCCSFLRDEKLEKLGSPWADRCLVVRVGPSLRCRRDQSAAVQELEESLLLNIWKENEVSVALVCRIALWKWA